MFGSAAAAFLPPALRWLAEHHPGVRVVSQEVDVDQAHAEVSAGRVDLALGLDYPDAPLARDEASELVRLHAERFSLAVPEAGAPPAGTSWRLTELADRDWILPAARTYYGRAIRTACRRAGFEPRVVHEVTDTATSLAMVGAGLGVAPLTGLMLRLRSEGIVPVPLDDPVERHVVVAVRAAARGGRRWRCSSRRCGRGRRPGPERTPCGAIVRARSCGANGKMDSCPDPSPPGP